MGLGRDNKITSIRWNSTVTSPFKSITRELYPETMEDVLAWAQELWLHHGLYSQAINKAVRYFMTDIEIGNSQGEKINYATRTKYKSFLKSRYDVMTEMASIGDEVVAFGNSFTSLYIPFVRNLVCPDCGFSAPLKEMYRHIKWQDYSFKGKCPGIDCRFKGTFKVHDIKLPTHELNPTIVHWPPQLMGINKHPVSGRTIYTFDAPESKELVAKLDEGDRLYLEETPMEMIEAVHLKQKMEFYSGEIYHMTTPTPTYISEGLGGWGLPKFMAEFENAIMVMLLDKYNEVIISDYIVPFRVLSPPPGQPAMAGSSDPMLNIGAGNFVAKAKTMLESHRKNPSGWNFFPFALNYQMLGGEAKNLTPVELLEHMEMRLLNSMGIPQEMYSSSFNQSAGPIIGFKMFERVWQHFADELNKWLRWFVDKNGELFQWEKVDARLVPVSVFEDPDIREAKLQLAASKQVSKSTAFRTLDLDAEYEEERVAEEEEAFAKRAEEKARKMEKKQINMQAVNTPAPGEAMLMAEQQAAAAQGAPPPAGPGGAPGGMPPSSGGNTGNATMDEMFVRAEQVAGEIFQMPAGQRKSALIQLKKDDEALHALVTQQIKKIEQNASFQGLEMARQGQM
jgi:hypothetical protein